MKLEAIAARSVEALDKLEQRLDSIETASNTTLLKVNEHLNAMSSRTMRAQSTLEERLGNLEANSAQFYKRIEQRLGVTLGSLEGRPAVAPAAYATVYEPATKSLKPVVSIAQALPTEVPPQQTNILATFGVPVNSHILDPMS